MDEPEVVLRVRDYFQAQGFKMKGQPDEGDLPLNGGDLRVDLQGFQEGVPPDLLWIECKGSNINLKYLLADFVSLLLVLDEYGGQGILACPKDSYDKIIEYSGFLERLQKNIGKGTVQIMNVETNQK